ncbi:hypothetical protein R3P38DRAFT_2779832 [Favolaschia claudopus]|uniref:Uncharacterized protein n=1 Tax=Favolaschia claudopus TaxID=2862362 RepID=A0AAW0BBB7_9AGAR
MQNFWRSVNYSSLHHTTYLLVDAARDVDGWWMGCILGCWNGLRELICRAPLILFCVYHPAQRARLQHRYFNLYSTALRVAASRIRAIALKYCASIHPQQFQDPLYSSFTTLFIHAFLNLRERKNSTLNFASAISAFRLHSNSLITVYPEFQPPCGIYGLQAAGNQRSRTRRLTLCDLCNFFSSFHIAVFWFLAFVFAARTNDYVFGQIRRYGGKREFQPRTPPDYPTTRMANSTTTKRVLDTLFHEAACTLRRCALKPPKSDLTKIPPKPDHRNPASLPRIGDLQKHDVVVGTSGTGPGMCTEEEVDICVQRRWRRRRDQQFNLQFPRPGRSSDDDDEDRNTDEGRRGRRGCSRWRGGDGAGPRGLYKQLDKILQFPSPPTSLPLPSTLSYLLLPLLAPFPTSTTIPSTSAGFPTRRFDLYADINLDDPDATQATPRPLSTSQLTYFNITAVIIELRLELNSNIVAFHFTLSLRLRTRFANIKYNLDQHRFNRLNGLDFATELKSLYRLGFGLNGRSPNCTLELVIQLNRPRTQWVHSRRLLYSHALVDESWFRLERINSNYSLRLKPMLDSTLKLDELLTGILNETNAAPLEAYTTAHLKDFRFNLMQTSTSILCSSQTAFGCFGLKALVHRRLVSIFGSKSDAYSYQTGRLSPYSPSRLAPAQVKLLRSYTFTDYLYRLQVGYRFEVGQFALSLHGPALGWFHEPKYLY